jgi:uncharacterized lipoprotein YehR (DUF1307 family)
MNYLQFSKTIKDNLSGAEVTEQVTFGADTIIKTVNDDILINYRQTEFTSIEEAKQHIKEVQLQEEVIQEIYDNIDHNVVATLIREHHNIKVTDTLIESYIGLAASKLFSVDPVIQNIRSLNVIESLIENKIDYKLDDGSIIAIDEDTQDLLNALLVDRQDIVEHMRANKENFLQVVREI